MSSVSIDHKPNKPGAAFLGKLAVEPRWTMRPYLWPLPAEEHRIEVTASHISMAIAIAAVPAAVATIATPKPPAGPATRAPRQAAVCLAHRGTHLLLGRSSHRRRGGFAAIVAGDRATIETILSGPTFRAAWNADGADDRPRAGNRQRWNQLPVQLFQACRSFVRRYGATPSRR